MLLEQKNINTDPEILHSLEDKLTVALNIPSHQKYNLPGNNTMIRTAIKHQNILVWDNLLHGYTSNFWELAQQTIKTSTPQKTNDKWDLKITQLMLDLHVSIWAGRNTFLHGKDAKEAREKARQAIISCVKELYQNLHDQCHVTHLSHVYHSRTASLN